MFYKNPTLKNHFEKNLRSTKVLYVHLDSHSIWYIPDLVLIGGVNGPAKMSIFKKSEK